MSRACLTRVAIPVSTGTDDGPSDRAARLSHVRQRPGVRARRLDGPSPQLEPVDGVRLVLARALRPVLRVLGMGRCLVDWSRDRAGRCGLPGCPRRRGQRGTAGVRPAGRASVRPTRHALVGARPSRGGRRLGGVWRRADGRRRCPVFPAHPGRRVGRLVVPARGRGVRRRVRGSETSWHRPPPGRGHLRAGRATGRMGRRWPCRRDARRRSRRLLRRCSGGPAGHRPLALLRGAAARRRAGIGSPAVATVRSRADGGAGRGPVGRLDVDAGRGRVGAGGSCREPRRAGLDGRRPPPGAVARLADRFAE